MESIVQKPNDKFLVLTPKKRALELSLNQDRRESDLAKAIMQRLADHGNDKELNASRDLEFFRGFATAYSLRYGSDLVKMLQESDTVAITFVEREKR